MRRGELVWIGAALSLHAAVLALGAFLPDPSFPPDPAGARPPGVIDVAVVRDDPAPEASRPSPEAPRAEAPAPPSREGSVRPAIPGPRAPSPEPASTGAPPGGPAPAPGAPSSEYGDAPPPAAPVPGLGGAPVYALPGVLPDRPAPAPAPTRPPPPSPVDPNIAGKIVTQGIAAKDRQLGVDLPAAANVASALVAAVRSSAAPVVARARFVARLGPGGEVISVRAVQWTDGPASAWQAAAASASASLAGQRFRMPPAFAGGATVTVDVDSLLTLADGTVVAQAGKKKRSDGGNKGGGGLSFSFGGGGDKLYRVVHPNVQVSP